MQKAENSDGDVRLIFPHDADRVAQDAVNNDNENWNGNARRMWRAQGA